MTSKRQADRGFPLPTPHLGYETICVNFEIPNHPLYRRAIVGHLYDLAQWWTWEKTWIPGDVRAKEVSEEFRNLLLQTLSLGECGGQTTGGNVDCVIGQVITTATAGTPEGFLPCDGQTYLREDYPELYAVLDSNLIVDADHFNTPSIKDGRIPAGVGTYPVTVDGMSGTAVLNVGNLRGEYSHTLTVNEIPAHAHQQRYNSTSGMVQDNGFTGGYSAGITPAGTPYTPLTTADAGGGFPHMNMPPITGLRFFIRASACGGTSSPVTGVRLSGCLMEYTRNGTTWFVVPGWDTLNDCIIHPPIPHGMDLRFNNCNLEYSTDSAQTWDTVPGWADAKACIDTDTPYDLRFRDGVLQWSKNGGLSWAAVDGWEVAQPESELPCRSARSFVPEFFTVIHDLAFLLNGTSDPYAIAKFNAAAQWPFTEGTNFDVAFDTTWDMKQANDLSQRIAPLSVIGNQIQAAQAFFAAGCSSEWGQADIDAFKAAMATLPEWAELPGIWIDAAYDYPRELRDWAWGKMAYPIIGAPCVPVVPQDYTCYHDFKTDGMGDWSVNEVTGGTSSFTTNGFEVDGDCNSSSTILEIERPVTGNLDAMWAKVGASHPYGVDGFRVTFLARVGGSWTVVNYWQEYSNGVWTRVADMPAAADAVRIRLKGELLSLESCVNVFIETVTFVTNAIENPC